MKSIGKIDKNTRWVIGGVMLVALLVVVLTVLRIPQRFLRADVGAEFLDWDMSLSTDECSFAKFGDSENTDPISSCPTIFAGGNVKYTGTEGVQAHLTFVARRSNTAGWDARGMEEDAAGFTRWTTDGFEIDCPSDVRCKWKVSYLTDTYNCGRVGAYGEWKADGGPNGAQSFEPGQGFVSVFNYGVDCPDDTNTNSGPVCTTQPQPVVLSAQCVGTTPDVRLNWMLPQNSCTSGIIKAVDTNSAAFMSPGPSMTDTSYTDTNTPRGHSYKYAFKNHPNVRSNDVTVVIGNDGTCTIVAGNGNINSGNPVNNTNSASPNHKTCRQQQCVEVDGPGSNRCESGAECLPILEGLYVLTNPFNGLQPDYALENNKVRLSLPATSGNLTWSIRGTSGGTLDQYTGNRVLYTPGTINGDEIVSVSDGTNRAYIAIDVRYLGGISSLQVRILNELTMVAGLDFLLHTSLGADIGERIQFKAIGQYRDPETNQVSYKDVTALVNWSSTDNAIGAIVPGGLFSSLKTGTTSVYAISGDVSSNVVVVHVNPTFPTVNPSGYEPHFNPNPMARGYTTRFWVFIETDTGPNDLKIVSADLSQFNIAPVCAADSNSNLNSGGGECNSAWLMTPAEFEGQGRWYYLEFRVPFTVSDGVYPVRIQATSVLGQIDRHLTINLRVVSEVIKGDISGDGMVTIQDAIYALQVAVGKLKETSAKINVLGDCNGDGHIGLPEAICVLHALTL